MAIVSYCRHYTCKDYRTDSPAQSHGTNPRGDPYISVGHTEASALLPDTKTSRRGGHSPRVPQIHTRWREESGLTAETFHGKGWSAIFHCSLTWASALLNLQRPGPKQEVTGGTPLSHTLLVLLAWLAGGTG